MADQQEKESTPAKAATEKAEAKAPAAKQAPAAAKPASPKTYAYVGPARPFGVPLMPNAILRGEPVAVIPDLGPQMEEHPTLRRLFVPVAELAKARQELASPGSGLGIIYRDIQTASAKARKA